MRRVAEATGKPYISFDGDQADFRNYSEAQFETRIEAFVELMRKNKEGK
jgi:benzoyl-CoA reductase/2-hydroxyglutaryl-CoA dehydratase subunit BcrC/BadD/HgdB